ncbi:acetylcholinesterase-like protein [Leptotrombidium deliense]|uniref:Carboxylic ester hydrolase n=1 Tax=Leptotrombidium deliense TaxID=299467 RepID=A0A443SD88_9ACAR|nr:acetylcholinesterase-like protein [Leptotrombidium deliense]
MNVKCVVSTNVNLNESEIDFNLNNDRNFESVTVETKSGLIEGFKKNLFGNYVNTFLGIPYAQPPINSLRFKRPIAIDRWNQTLQAMKLKPNCLQYYDVRLASMFTLLTHEMSEDCLYLNVWTKSVNKTAMMPIMIWVHGGGFTEGSVNIDENIGEVLALYGDVVVVTFNYRVGALGFLDLGIAESPGNQGLYDQSTAFRWVKDNAHSFGGDPNSITLFGVSSGAIAIGLHMVSPESKHLFNRAILQSGSPVLVNSYYSNSANVAQKVAEVIQCVSEDESTEESLVTEKSGDEIDVLPIHKDVDSVLKCLRSKSATQFIEAQRQIITNSSFTFTPSPYEEFLPLMPTDAIKEKVVSDAFSNIHQVLMGLTKDEASLFLHFHSPEVFTNKSVTKNISTLEETQEMFVDVVSKRNVHPTQAHLLATLLLKESSNETLTKPDYVAMLHTALSDLAFNCPSIIFAEELAKANKTVYFYVYNHKSAGHPNFADWMGVPHLSLMPYVFGHPLRYPLRYSGNDIEVSKQMMKSWSHFAKTGKSIAQSGSEWKQFTSDNQDYIEIETNKATMKQKYHDNACQLFKIGFDTIERR